MREVAKIGLFTVRLIVRIDISSSTLMLAFRDYFLCFWPYIMIMCSEMDFTQIISHFYQTIRTTLPPYCLLLLCHKTVG